MRDFSEGVALSIGPFQKVQHEVAYFPYVVKKMKSRRKLSKNCRYTVKFARFLVRVIFQHP